MDEEDYSKIQRELGFIEGIICSLNDDFLQDRIASAIEHIDQILINEMEKNKL